MRRDEFSVDEEKEIEAFLSGMSFGFLGTVGEDGRPRVTPLNFVYDQGIFYFHGSRIGEKMNHLKASPMVSFSVADEYASFRPTSRIPILPVRPRRISKASR
ncbi:Pyridoxamine 5'-phosphate oxidase [Paenibacillus sp. P1XP2]|nr:Pyridoxamine 5'-phosphate oxidase [Paenibacillus sp. P1XP2]